MPRLNVPNLGAIGIVRDLPYSEIPPNAWSSGKNVRMDGKQVVSFLGDSVGATSSVVEQMLHVRGVTAGTAHYWFYVGLDGTPEVRPLVFDGSTHHDLTPSGGPLLGDESDIVVSAFINNNLVFTNGIDVPHMWDLVPANIMTTLTGWDANWTAKGILSSRKHLIAYNMVESGTEYPFRVRWSDVAGATGVPASWDATDATLQTGFNDIAEALTPLVFAKELQDTIYIYNNGQIFGMKWIGGQFIWKFFPVSTSAGALSQRCVTNVRNSIQVVVTTDDVVAMNGQSVKSIVNDVNRDWMFGQLNQSEYAKTFAFTHLPKDEVWICFPAGQSLFPNLALVWNFSDNTWAQRELPANAMSLASALDIGAGNTVPTWASSTGYTWATPPIGRWNSASFSVTEEVLILGAEDDIVRLDAMTNLFSGAAKTSNVERLGLRLDGDRVNMITRLWPRMESSAPVNIYIGGQMDPEGPVDYHGPYPFDPSTDSYVSCAVNGRAHAIKYESTSDVSWTLKGHEIEWKRRGLY